MSKPLSEERVLKKLKITDFRHLTKDKVMTMASMLDKMDPDVAKKALEQFPEFTSTIRQILHEYKLSLDEALKINAKGSESYYDTCNAIIASCQKELENGTLTYEQRMSIMDRMVVVAKMKGEKDSETKRVLIVMSTIAFAAIGLTTSALLTVLGGNFKIDADALKNLNE